MTQSAAPTGRLFAACASGPGAGNQGKGVHVSTDDGVNWFTPEVCTSPFAGSPRPAVGRFATDDPDIGIHQ